MGLVEVLTLVASVARTAAMERIRTTGPFFYALVWMCPALFSCILVVFIYRDSPALRDYAIVGGACTALLFGMQYNAGQILDEQRQRGTLGNLFASPGPRYVWLAGFQLFAVLEAAVAAGLAVGAGAVMFGLTVRLDLVSLAVALALLLVCLWGFSMLVGAVGLALRDANQLSNLLSPITGLLAGTMYPVDLMPAWVRIPSHCLPFSYGTHAMAEAVTAHASVMDLADDLIPLAGFAVALPLLGLAAFTAVERRVRLQGALDLI
jgi:ABC-type multidrug transport system permease subunit